MKQALIIVDVQPEYFPSGKLELYKPEKALAQTQKALQLSREKKWPIFFIRHVSSREDASIFLPGTAGVELHPTLTPRIRNMREDQDLTQTQMASYLNIHQTTYSDYEIGNLNIPIPVLMKIADLFDTSIDYLVGRTDEASATPSPNKCVSASAIASAARPATSPPFLHKKILQLHLSQNGL